MGRPKGAKNIRSFDAEILAARLGINPLEIVMKFAAGDWKGLGYESDRYEIETPSGNIKQVFVITPNMRLDASKEASKYLFSQKKSIELSTGEEGFKVVIEDYAKK
jgi:hypothetical protein